MAIASSIFLEAENKHCVFTGFVDKGVHIFNVYSSGFETLQKLLQRPPVLILNLHRNNVGLADGKAVFSLIHSFASSTLSIDESQDAKIGGIGYRKRPDINVIIGEYSP